MNWHWLASILLIFCSWVIAQTELPLNTALEREENVDEIKERSSRAVFSPTSRPQTISTEPVEIGWHIPTTKRPVVTTAKWMRTTRATKRPSTTTPRSWLATKNSTKAIGWLITTTPRSIKTTKKSKNTFGWDISLGGTTPKPISTTKIHQIHNERKTTTTGRPWWTTKNSTNNAEWVTTTPRLLSTTQVHSLLNERWTTTTQKPFNTTIRFGWTTPPTTPQTLSTNKYFPNHAAWTTPPTPMYTVRNGWIAPVTPAPITPPRGDSGWFPTTTRVPVTTWPTRITTKKHSSLFAVRNTTTKSITTTTRRPTTSTTLKTIITQSTTQNPFAGYGRRNMTSPNVGTWKKITPLNTQLSPPAYPHQNGHDNHWNQWNDWNANHINYNRYPGLVYVQTSNVIPQNNNHLGYHFVTTYENGFRNTAPLNSRHYFEQLYHYFNNNNVKNDRNDHGPSQLKMRPTPSPFGHPPVLYNQLLSNKINEDSAESIVTPPAMIVGLENLILFCHFNENDDNVVVFVNHDDMEIEAAEAKRVAEQKFAKYLLDLVIADMGKHGKHPPLNTNEIFASLSGQQVMSNQDQASTDARSDQTQQQASDLSKIFSSQNGQLTIVPQQDIDGHNWGPLQPSLDQSSAESHLNQLLSTLNANNPTKPSDRKLPETPDLNQLVEAFNRNTPTISAETETSTDETPLQFTI